MTKNFFFYSKVPTLFGIIIMMCQLVITDRRRCFLIGRAACHALLCSLLQLLLVPAVAMGQCGFAVTGDHTVTTRGSVTLANAAGRCSAGPLGNSDNGNTHEARDLGKSLSPSILLFQ